MNHVRLVALIVSLALGMGMCVDALAQTAAPPDQATAHFADGYNQLKAGNADAAAKEFIAGLETKPDNAMAWFYLGEARLKLGSTDLAKTAFERSLALDQNGQLAESARARLAQMSLPSAPQGMATTRAALSVQVQMLDELSGNIIAVPVMAKGKLYDSNPMHMNFKTVVGDSLLSAVRRRFAATEIVPAIPGARAEPDATIVVDVHDSYRTFPPHWGQQVAIDFTATFTMISSSGQKLTTSSKIEGPPVHYSVGSMFDWGVEVILEGQRMALEPSFKTLLTKSFEDFLDSPELVAFVGNLQPRRAVAAMAKAPASTPAGPTIRGQPLEPLSKDDQAHYLDVLKNGRPSQMYLLAVKMYGQNRIENADNLCQAIVDRYPDDPYAAKAIDRLDAAQLAASKAAQQQQMMGQQQAFHEQQAAQQQELAQASAQQRIANCKSQCDAVENACDASVDNQNKQAGFGALAGMLTGNKSAAYGAVGGVTDTSQCAANAEACATGCN